MDLEERIAVAHGEKKVDLLLKNARIVDVFSGNIYRGNIAIHQDLIVGIGDYDAENTIDLHGQLVAPGFFDAHVHIESSMITIPEYAKTVMPLGTTSVIIDPHEIANVLGLEGIRYMINSAACSPLGVYIMLSSCVPATRKETSGATISARDLTLFINHPWVLGLAEMMDYPGVIHRDIEVMLKILLTLEKKKKIDGHAPGLTGKDLSAYIASGIDSDHECTTREEALEKLRLGMAIIIREGTAAKNLDTLLPLTDPKNIHRFLFCTDDRHLYDLLNEGHINSMVKRAIKSGIDPVLAMRMATLNPALHYEIPNVGAIAPGYHADLIVFDDFKNMDISQVLKNGQSIYKNGELTTSWELDSDISVRSTMNVKWLALPDIEISAEGTPHIRVIDIIPNQIVTRQLLTEGKIEDGKLVSDVKRDILKIVVIERHMASGDRGIGFVHGFRLKKGALASSVAHDSHNIIATGTDDEDIMAAVEEVIKMRGGLACAVTGQVVGSLPLPIAGLMSPKPYREVSAGMESLLRITREMGSSLEDPFMQLSFLALPVIPELKITDRGLFDVNIFDFVSLFAP